MNQASSKRQRSPRSWENVKPKDKKKNKDAPIAIPIEMHSVLALTHNIQ